MKVVFENPTVAQAELNLLWLAEIRTRGAADLAREGQFAEAIALVESAAAIYAGLAANNALELHAQQIRRAGRVTGQGETGGAGSQK